MRVRGGAMYLQCNLQNVNATTPVRFVRVREMAMYLQYNLQNDIFPTFVIHSNNKDNYIGEMYMRYSMDSYLELEEEQVQKFFEVIAEIRKEINEGKTKGRSYNDFIQKGVTTKTLSILKAGKYITWHNKTDTVWISWENNFYPDRTIENLYWELKRSLGYNLPMLGIKTFDK